MAIAQLTVDITAKMASFENEIKKVSSSAKKQADSISDSFGAIGNSLKGIVSAYAGIEGIRFIADLVTDTANYAKEVQNLSTLAGISTDTFQKLAYGAKSVGIEQEKLGDILKDVNDKFGDFFTTGGGELKDFFDVIAPKVGVTADNFRRLSGPEALQLYVSSLEKAGVSQQQMTFYMEALASDSTLLVPLLKNNGEAMKEMGEKAKEAGVIMSEKALNDTKKYNEQLKKLEDQASETGRSIALDLIPALTGLFKFFNDSADSWNGPIEKMSNSMRSLKLMVGLVPFVGEQLTSPKVEPVSAFNQKGYQGRIRGDEGVTETTADIAAKAKAEEDRLKKLASERSRFASKAQSEAERAKRDAEQQQKAIDDYIKSLDQQNSKFKDQTVEQKAIAEIESGRFGKVLPAQRERIINSAQILDADKKEIEFQLALEEGEQRRKDLQNDLMEQGKNIFEQMRTPAEIYADQIVKINQLYDKQAISLETLERASQSYFEAYQAGANDQGKKLTENEKLTKNLESAFEATFSSAIRDGLNFGSLLNKLGEDIANVIYQQQFIKPLASGLSSALTGGLTGVVDGVGGFLSGLFSFDGGGYTGSGTRSGGVDGKGGFYAVLHPEETVIDHTKGQRIASGGRNVMISQTFNFSGSNDRNQVLGAAQLGAAMAKQQLMDDRQRGRS